MLLPIYRALGFVNGDGDDIGTAEARDEMSSGLKSGVEALRGAFTCERHSATRPIGENDALQLAGATWVQRAKP